MSDPIIDADEEWREVVGYPDYAVSNLGRVKRLTPYRSTKPGRILKTSSHRDGHLMVVLSSKSVLKRLQLHRVVAFAFLGGPPTAIHVVAHGNGDPSDNRLSNLRWATPAENFNDRKAHGTWPSGEKNANSRLTDVQVRLIRARVLIGGESKAEVSRLFQITDTHAGRIVDGKIRRQAGGYGIEEVTA